MPAHEGHRSHNPKVAGSNPAPATTWKARPQGRAFCITVSGVLPEAAVETVRRWAEAKTEPAFRDRMRVAIEVGPRSLTIFESSVMGDQWIQVSVAKLGWSGTTKLWTLYRSTAIARPTATSSSSHASECRTCSTKSTRTQPPSSGDRSQCRRVSRA